MRRKSIVLLSLLCWLSAGLLAQQNMSTKVLFIPLDDRPPCLQFPLRMGQIGQVNLVSPPRELLGRFTTYGQCDAIINWIKQQDLREFDGAILSLDMLAYGGLVASRVHATPESLALQRVEIIRTIRAGNPKMKLYGSSVIMRLAPTADGKNEAYREKLSKWAEVSADPANQSQTTQLVSEIPAEALADYQAARRRNLQVNRYALQLVKDGILDYLILSQDDAKPKGVHIKERESLIESSNTQGLSERVAVQPGADEVSMLLLARTVSDRFAYHPRVKVIYSSEAAANQVMPFEDRPLRKTVSFHLLAVGAQEVNVVEEAEIIFYVFASRFEPQSAQNFAALIQQQVSSNPKNPQGIIIADVDPRGDVQGGDVPFTEVLKKDQVFAKTYGYACWNTAGNTIGTALPHGIVYGMAKTQLAAQRKAKNISAKTSKNLSQQLLEHQSWFMLNRLLDDYTYHSLVRPEVQQSIREKKWNTFRLTPEQTETAEQLCTEKMLPLAESTAVQFFGKKQSTKLSQFRFDLPWNRTFEAEIDFSLTFSKKP